MKAQNIMSPNLVPNPSFEDYLSCPTDGFGEIYLAVPWTAANSISSSDYFNACSSNLAIILALQVQFPRTGYGEASIILTGAGLNNYREYIETKLKTKLISNKKYCTKVYTNLNNYAAYAIENIGMYFSQTEIFQPPLSAPIPNIPQIKNNKGIIKDTINWVLISGVYDALGGEEYIVIGNFDSAINTNYSYMGGTGNSFYFFDDISVCECNFYFDLGQDTTLCAGDTKILTASLPNAVFTWQDSSHAATYEVKEPGTYWVRAYVAEYNISSSDTIVIYPEKEEICNPPLIIPNYMSPNGDGQSDNFQLGNLEYYDINLQVYNRWGTLLYQNAHYTNDYNCNGCAAGVYYYLISAKGLRNGEVKEYHGSLTVFR